MPKSFEHVFNNWRYGVFWTELTLFFCEILGQNQQFGQLVTRQTADDEIKCPSAGIGLKTALLLLVPDYQGDAKNTLYESKKAFF